MVSVYALQVGLPEEIKKLFWEDLDEVTHEIPRSEKLFIGGDFSGHIGTEAAGYDGIHGGLGFGERNAGVVSVLDFAVVFDLLVANSFFKKKEDHLVTFKSSSCKTQIDYFLTRKEYRRSCKDLSLIHI